MRAYLLTAASLFGVFGALLVFALKEQGFLAVVGLTTLSFLAMALFGMMVPLNLRRPRRVLEVLRQRVDELNHRILPDGVKVTAFYDRTELVQSTLRTVFHNLVEGATLVILVLAFGALVAAGLPLLLTILGLVATAGALYLAVIAILPQFLLNGFKVEPIPFIGPWLDAGLPRFITEGLGVQFYFGGTSLLIVVGVAMDTVQQVESQLIMRHYDGFMKKTRIRGRRA